MKATEVWEASLANRAEGTRFQYSKHFKRFMNWTGFTPDDLRDLKYRKDQAKKPWKRNHVENLVRKYLQALEAKEFACSTQKLAYAAIRSFFVAQGMPLFLKREDRPSGCAFGSKTVSREEIRQLRNAAENLRNKTLILFLKDSGLRESDAAKLLWKDLKDLGEDFTGFTIQTKKKKTKARGFVGPETTEMLRLYLEKRLQGTAKLPPETDFADHPVFALLKDPTKPYRPQHMSKDIGNIIRLAGLEGATPHGLRKFWQQNMHTENIAYQKQMNGRALTEVERAYFWKEISELFEMYKQNYHNLKVDRQEFRETEERLRRDYESQIKVLRDRVSDVERVNAELKQNLNEVTLTTDQVQELLKRIEALERHAQK